MPLQKKCINSYPTSSTVMALSETWTSKQETNKPFPDLRNYQPFYATPEATTKNGCEFYIKKGLKFKSRRELDLTYYEF